MPLTKFLTDKRIRDHKTSPSEISDLFQIVDRDIKDAGIKELSPDRRFATAYNAALQLGTIILHAEGYRTDGTGHHWITFKVLPEIMGKEIKKQADLFELCRRKRNMTDYDRAGGISLSEAEDIIKTVVEFKHEVVKWINSNHSELLD